LSTSSDSTSSDETMRVFQVAISSLDVDRSRNWYIENLGFLYAGEINPDADIEAMRATGDITDTDLASIQGLPGASCSKVAWTVDQQEFFQFELFAYSQPPVRPRPAGWRPCDIGYTTVGLHVMDFDATVARLRQNDNALLSEPIGAQGDRRVCVFDPDGVLLELMEGDLRGADPVERPRPFVPVVTRSVTLSVPDLAKSLRFFVETLGMRPVDPQLLHQSRHEALWGLDGARRESALLDGGDFWVEIVQYLDPVGTPRPADYRISDQGLLNVAYGSRDRATYKKTRDRAVGGGGNATNKPKMPVQNMNYLTDDQGFSVEVNWYAREADAMLGLLPVTETA
jgi:catechol 2,3-dioxygenase-like lactoylglutathione lyase family enzyme